MAKRGVEPPLPSLECGKYLWDLTVKAGISESGIGGPSVLSWKELQAFGQIFNCNEEELEIMRKLSAAFLEGLVSGQDALAFSPMENEQ
jgi:hypothetical protein